MMSLLLLEVYVEFRETLRLIVFTLLSWRWAINHDNESLFSRNVHGKTKNVLPSPEVYCDMRNKFAFEFFSSQGGWIQKEEKERESNKCFENSYLMPLTPWSESECHRIIELNSRQENLNFFPRLIENWITFTQRHWFNSIELLQGSLSWLYDIFDVIFTRIMFRN